MKTFRWLAIVVFCGIVVSSCFNPPEYPDSPEITFKSLDYKKGGTQANGNKAADTIILIVNFKDGDGDVGVSSDELAPPFNDRWYYTRQPLSPDPQYIDDCTNYNRRCWFISSTTSEFDKYIDIQDLKKPEYDTLFVDNTLTPPGRKDFSKPYNCTNWEVVYYDDDNDETTASVPLDTLFFNLNPHYNNIFVDFEVKNEGDFANPYTKFDEKQFFTFPNCGVRIWNGRVPILSENLNKDTPLEGTIRYAIPSQFFTTLFGAKTLRLRVRIEDRAFHSSNEIFTRDFTLTE